MGASGAIPLAQVHREARISQNIGVCAVRRMIQVVRQSIIVKEEKLESPPFIHCCSALTRRRP